MEIISNQTKANVAYKPLSLLLLLYWLFPLSISIFVNWIAVLAFKCYASVVLRRSNSSLSNQGVINQTCHQSAHLFCTSWQGPLRNWDLKNSEENKFTCVSL